MKILINEIEFNVSSSAYAPFWKEVNSGKWEKKTFEIIDYFVSKGNITLDIGCWVGPISFYMAAKGAKVYSIDPDPRAYEIFTENLNLNQTLKQLIHPYKIALTAENKDVNLYARKQYGDSSTSILKRTRDTLGKLTVKGICLDEFIRIADISQIDFIKMDIEGAEFELLPHLSSTLEKLKYPTLYISFHYSHLNEFIYRKKIGLKYVSLILMKLEKIIGFYLFKVRLRAAIKGVLSLAEKYRFIYDDSGKNFPIALLDPDLMLKYNLNLVFTDRQWVKAESKNEKL